MKILVTEGNVLDVRQKTKELSGHTPGEGYAKVLQFLDPELSCDIFSPADTDDAPPQSVENYDGVVITGSALNAYDDKPAIHRQVEFCHRVFEAGVPFFGSCWGLQVACLTAGGTVEKNHRGREVAYSRSVQLTSAGRDHPMHSGRSAVFDAPATHLDHITVLPENAVVTAFNAYSEVQAAEISHGNSVFWGVQYHPEFDLRDVATALRRYGTRLVDEERIFRDRDDVEDYANNLDQLNDAPARRDIAWRYAIGPEILDPHLRLVEIANWLRFCREKMVRVIDA